MSINFVKEYFEDGFICPYCGATENVASINEPENIGHVITQDVECSHCESKWKEVYELVRTKNLITGGLIFTKEEAIANDSCGFCGTTEFLCGCNKRD